MAATTCYFRFRTARVRMCLRTHGFHVCVCVCARVGSMCVRCIVVADLRDSP